MQPTELFYKTELPLRMAKELQRYDHLKPEFKLESLQRIQAMLNKEMDGLR